MKKIISLVLSLAVVASMSITSFATSGERLIQQNPHLTNQQKTELFTNLSKIKSSDIQMAEKKFDMHKLGKQSVKINDDFILETELTGSSPVPSKVEALSTFQTKTLAARTLKTGYASRTFTMKSAIWPNPTVWTTKITGTFQYDGLAYAHMVTTNATIDTMIGCSGTTYNVRAFDFTQSGKTFAEGSAQFDITFGVQIGNFVVGTTQHDSTGLVGLPNGSYF